MANDDFTIHRLPIFRTDSLENERDGADIAVDSSGSANWTFSAVEESEELSIEVELPYEPEGESHGLTVDIDLPLQEHVQENCDIRNEVEYFAVLQGMLDTVKEHMSFYRRLGDPEQEWEYRSGVLDSIQDYLIRDPDLPSDFFEPYVQTMLDRVEMLNQEYGDGRLFKIFEDKVLGIVVKNFMKYDFVVGNPPYVRIQNLPSNQRTYFENLYDATSGNYDIYCLFIERGLDWLEGSNSRLGYITSNQFLLAKYGESTEASEGIRKNILKRSRIEKIFDFRDAEVFEDAANLPVIIRLAPEESEEARSDSSVRCIRVKGNISSEVNGVDASVIQLVRDEEDNPGYRDEFIDVFDYPQGELDERFWTFMPPREKEVFETLEENSSLRLKDLTDQGEGVFAGTQTSANTVFVVTPVEGHRIAPTEGEPGETVRVIPSGDYQEAEIEKRLLCPWLEGIEVKRWQAEWGGQHVIFPYPISEEGIADDDPYDPSEMQDRFPEAWNYFNRDEISSTLKNRDGISSDDEDWYRFAYPKSHARFGRPKLISRDMSEKSRFMLDQEGIWYFKTPYGTQPIPDYQHITEKLACQLNSKALEFYLKQIAPMLLSGKYRYQTRYLNELPVVIPEDDELNSAVNEAQEIITGIDRNNKSKRFPEAYLQGFDGNLNTITYEWSTDRRPVEESMTEIQERADRTYQIEIGRSDEIVSPYMDTIPRARYVYASVVNRSVKSGEISEIPIPQNDQEVDHLVDEWQSDRTFYEDIEARKPEIEDGINREVYELFDLDQDTRDVIEDFCSTF